MLFINRYIILYVCTVKTNTTPLHSSSNKDSKAKSYLQTFFITSSVIFVFNIKSGPWEHTNISFYVKKKKERQKKVYVFSSSFWQ